MIPLVDEDGKVHREWQGANVTVRATIVHAGELISSILIAGQSVRIPNADLDAIVVTARKVRTPAQVSAAAKLGAQTKRDRMGDGRISEIARKAANTRWGKRKTGQ